MKKQYGNQRAEAHSAGANSVETPSDLSPSAPSPSDQSPSAAAPFWRTKSLSEMTDAEWESLCDHCGRCCLIKLEFEESGEIVHTDIACKLLALDGCHCKDYANRRDLVDDCLKLTPENLATTKWLPPSCAYKLIAEGKDLYDWHPLVSGRAESVQEAGISVCANDAASEADIAEEDYEDHIVTWPTENVK